MSLPQNVYSHLRKWLQYQKKLQSILFTQSIDQFNLQPESQSQDLQNRFFVTAHFGMYPLIIKYLSNIFPDRKIICLVGKQKSIQGIIQLTNNLELDVQYVEVGDSLMFFRKLIKLNKSGAVFLSLIDIPLGVSDKNEQWLPFLNGNIKVKTGLLKIAKKLKLPIRFIVSRYNLETNDVPITSNTVNDIDTIFGLFSKYVENEPYLWDKVMDIFKFYESSMQPGMFIPFKLEGNFFALDVSSHQVHRINEAFYNKICDLKASKKISSEHVEQCKKHINDQTNFNIQCAV
ncbi:hypothetical protein R1T43_05770 [Alteromonas sp. CI.11.F.A3]|uniref:hypothetical protein n=1 Tax=Alteromonas sp. CI.11.F.A3 TaxID=3079555 RepID=UPI002943321A|nr:hypothetical protein [Alteromonas sp. CI.11.F.A3]WOI38539.1 hypothetical protein R1T43_05770 [Alteromonas sp. CI.11.F.A3]